MTANKYWETLKYCLTETKEKIPSQCIIGKFLYIFIAVIGVKIYSNHPKNMNHVNKETKDLVSIIITLGTNISGW